MASAAIAQEASAPASANTATTSLGDPPSLEIFAQAPFVDQIALSPDGTRIAFISQRGDDKVLGHFHVADKKITSVRLGKSKIRGLFWGDNSRIVIVDSQTTGLPEFAGWRNEFYLAQIIDLDVMAMSQIFGHMDDFYNIIEGYPQRIKVNGEYRIAASSFRMQGDNDLCLYSFGLSHNAVPHFITDGSRHTRNFVVAPDGVPIAYADFDDDSATKEKEWMLFFNTSLSMDTKFRRIYTIKGAAEYPSLIGLGRDGKSVVISIKNTDNDGFDYHEISADGVVSEPIDIKGRDLDRTALFHPTTGRLAGFTTRDDWFTYDYTDPLLKKLADAIPQVIGGDYRFEVADFAEDPRKMIVYGESPNDAGSYFFLDFSTGATIPLASKYPELPEPWITQKKPIKYTAADGLEIHGYLTLPPGKEAKSLPLIVLPHGGPGARDYIDFDAETQAFASRGYAVLQPNFRGSTGYGLDFLRAGDGEWGRKMQTDLSDGIQYLAKQGLIDAKRVAIYGASYGGYAALAGATLDPPGTYRCAVSIAGVSDIRSMLAFDAEGEAADTQSLLVVNEKKRLGDPKHYDDISPARQAAKAYCPILLIHGTDDTVVSIDQSQRMERALKAAGKEVQFITFEHQTHWEDMASSRVTMIKAAMDFIQKYNPAKV